MPDAPRELRVIYTVLRFLPDRSASDRRRTIAAREEFYPEKRPVASKRLNPHAGRGGLSNVILVGRYTISDLGGLKVSNLWLNTNNLAYGSSS